MNALFRSTTAYRAMAQDRRQGTQAQSTLVIFPDEVCLRALLKECAKAFFGAEDGSREAELIDRESYSDCYLLPAAGEKLTAEIGAFIIDEALLKPLEGEKKLFVLDGFQNAAPLVQNKLLKALEEPADGVCYLLGATSEYPVLPTVRSRVKKYEVPPFSEEALEGALRRMYPGRENYRRASAASGGVYSVAEKLLLGGDEQFRLAEEFLRTKDPAAFGRAAEGSKDKTGFLSALALLLRDMLFCREGKREYTAFESAPALAKEYPTGAILSAIEAVFRAEREVKFNANFGQCVYHLALAVKEEREKWQRLS